MQQDGMTTLFDKRVFTPSAWNLVAEMLKIYDIGKNTVGKREG